MGQGGGSSEGPTNHSTTPSTSISRLTLTEEDKKQLIPSSSSLVPQPCTSTVRVVAISDTHNNLKLDEKGKAFAASLPSDAEVFIHCGDMSDQGSSEEILAFNEWLGLLKDKYKYRLVICGNHDLVCDVDNYATLRKELESSKLRIKRKLPPADPPHTRKQIKEELLSNATHVLEDEGLVLTFPAKVCSAAAASAVACPQETSEEEERSSELPKTENNKQEEGEQQRSLRIFGSPRTRRNKFNAKAAFADTEEAINTVWTRTLPPVVASFREGKQRPEGEEVACCVAAKGDSAQQQQQPMAGEAAPETTMGTQGKRGRPPIDLLVTHGPPLGILDAAPLIGKSLGSSALAGHLATMARANEAPTVHLFGHVHDQRGVLHGEGSALAQCLMLSSSGGTATPATTTKTQPIRMTIPPSSGEHTIAVPTTFINASSVNNLHQLRSGEDAFVVFDVPV